VPRQFSWIDQRLVRDGHISRCTTEALAVYLALVTVADADGLSYYSDATLGRLLRLESCVLSRARAELIELGLIAYQSPLYQVLSLEKESPVETKRERAGGEAVLLGDVLRSLMGGAK
jgi:hypothetical protein